MIGYLARKGFSRLAELQLIQTEYNNEIGRADRRIEMELCTVPDTNLFSFVKIL